MCHKDKAVRTPLDLTVLDELPEEAHKLHPQDPVAFPPGQEVVDGAWRLRIQPGQEFVPQGRGAKAHFRAGHGVGTGAQNGARTP